MRLGHMYGVLSDEVKTTKIFSYSYTIGYENIYTRKYFLRIFYDTKISQSTVLRMRIYIYKNSQFISRYGF